MSVARLGPPVGVADDEAKSWPNFVFRGSSTDQGGGEAANGMANAPCATGNGRWRVLSSNLGG